MAQAIRRNDVVATRRRRMRLKSSAKMALNIILGSMILVGTPCLVVLGSAILDFFR